MFRNGIAFGELSSLAKKAYIDVAEKELLASGQKATISMIAISTGLTRKEVSVLRKENTHVTEKSNQQNRAVRVISGWISDPEFCNTDGKPKLLKVQGSKGTFEQLVNKHSGDMPFRAMMKELLRTGAIEEKEEGKVALIRAAYIPSNDENGMYDLLGKDVSSLISTIKHNIIDQNEEPYFQRKVCYDSVPAEHLEEFKVLANKESQQLLLKLNDWLAKHDMDNQTKIMSKKPMKVGVGIYYFEEKVEVKKNEK